MAKPSLRSASVCLLCAGWIYACGGSEFNAGGGGGTSSGGNTSAGSSATAGSTASGGDSVGGSAGNASGGSSQAGTASGGSSTSGTGGAVGEGGAIGEAGANVGGNTGTAGSGGVRNSGDCVAAKDCPTGDKCVALYPGGFRACVATPTPLTCTASDACCPGITECAAGSSCVETPVGPSCGLITRPTIACVKEACTTAADCSGSNAICVPAGALDRKVSTCLTGGCRLDTDCKDEAGGKCEPVTPNCCGGPSGLYCVYPSKGCRNNSDCTTGTGICQIVNQKTGECGGSSICAG
ncbi:MAG TPA: hypothetical protein VGM44_22655 [Polyangiaceae bacterium]